MLATLLASPSLAIVFPDFTAGAKYGLVVSKVLELVDLALLAKLIPVVRLELHFEADLTLDADEHNTHLPGNELTANFMCEAISDADDAKDIDSGIPWKAALLAAEGTTRPIEQGAAQHHPRLNPLLFVLLLTIFIL